MPKIKVRAMDPGLPDIFIVVRWLFSFLKDRRQRVKIGSCLSWFAEIPGGGKP